MRMKSRKYDARMKCPVCGEREKDVILPCTHMFCEECIQKNLASRSRICPIDRMKFQQSDVKKIMWGEGDM